MPREYYAKEIVKLFEGLSGKVLIPRSAVGWDEVIEGLKALGTDHATLLGKDGAKVSTAEHLLAVLYMLGIDNLTVEFFKVYFCAFVSKSFCTHCSYEIILCMYPILEKERLSEEACLLKIKAPHIAVAEPGQFVMVQHTELAELIPLPYSPPMKRVLHDL